ncbi:hypothetical protein [Desulfatitalea tepidiphila]|uniref:hypothetical protein n=1 Tax=Desulfatitalea tepidiphila TaxID=1185843 RepID=UPI0006B5CDF2|nr:hypothetical protein [Desulfatitalea tepidiphila]
MGSKSECVTYVVGYKYSLGIQMVACHGPVDAVLGMRTDDYIVWSGAVSSTSQIHVNQPELYGGSSKEGGVVGDIDIEFGDADQGQNSYLTSRFGPVTPAFRGVLQFVLRRCYLGDSHYLKPWSFRVRNCARLAPGWNPGNANISGDANPAHMIRACIVNTVWGMGYLESDVDDASFSAAAQTLYAEGFGLSMIWDRAISIEDFIDEIKRHIDAVLYVERTTGKWELHLLRDDYDIENLPVLDPSNIVSVESYKRLTQAEMINAVVLKYQKHTATGDREESITVHHTAMIQRLGQTIHKAINYHGISRAALAAKVAARELKSASSDLSSATLVALPVGAVQGLREGSPFVFSWPKYGIQQEVMRVVTIDWGTLSSGKVRVTAMQDIYATPEASYVEVPQSGWVDPVNLPAPSPYRRLVEIPYYSLVRLYGESTTFWDGFEETSGIVGTLYVKPTDDAFSYRLWTLQPYGRSLIPTYMDRGTFAFAPSALLVDPIGKTDGEIRLENMLDVDLVAEDSYAYIGDELVKMLTVNPVSGVCAIARGVLDTVPADHAAGTRIWFADGRHGTDARVLESGDVATTRGCPITGKGELDIAAAPTDTMTYGARAIRPYPPGNVQVNAEPYPVAIAGALSLTWAHRDRIQQTAYIVEQDEGNIGPEPGVTYRLRIYGETGALLRTYTGIVGTSQLYTIAQEIADSGALGRPNESLRFVLDAQRGGWNSWQTHDHTIAECRGYGMFYGDHYGE